MGGLNICFVGVGSIAKRHILNLTALFRGRGVPLGIDCCRSSDRDLPEEIQALVRRTYRSPAEVPGGYDAVFVTNPTSLHLGTILDFRDKSDHFFIEKPLCDIGQDVSAVLELARDPSKLLYVACPLRYTAVIQYLKQQVDVRQLYSVRGISSSYLPDWRPGMDYRRTYSARRELGGGVSIDLIHEWDYLTYLLGRPQRVFCLRKTVSDLEIDSDDLAVYLADYGDKTAELHLDYFGRRPIRQLDLFCREDTITGDLIAGTVRYRRSGKTVDLSEQRNDYQMRELEAFFRMVSGEETNANPVQTALETLHLTEGVIV